MSLPLDIDGMDTLILEMTHNGGQYSELFNNWSERHRKNWSAIKAELESLRSRIREMEDSLEILNDVFKFQSEMRGPKHYTVLGLAQAIERIKGEQK